MYTHPFEQLAVLNHEHHHELLHEATQYQLLGQLSAKPKPSHWLYQFLARFTLPSLHIRYSLG